MTFIFEKSIVNSLMFFALSLFFLSGCKNNDPHPELKDPIFIDLKKISDEVQKELESEEKGLNSLIKDEKRAEIRTLDVKLARKKLYEAKQKLRTLRQKAKFSKIRAEHRRIVARKEYRIAIEAGEDWPKSENFKRYQTNKKLRAVDLNWNKRVPKLQHANPNFAGVRPMDPKKE